jgi:hypothetical protein
MKQVNLYILIFGLVSWLSPAHAEELCQEFQQIEKKINAEAPKQIDKATELVQIRVNCEVRTVAYIKRLLVDHDLFVDGWRTRKQRQHNQLHCNLNGLASKSGWTVQDVMYDVNYNWLIEFLTTPEICNKT